MASRNYRLVPGSLYSDTVVAVAINIYATNPLDIDRGKCLIESRDKASDEETIIANASNRDSSLFAFILFLLFQKNIYIIAT